jgi:Ca2+-binding EF-hand superfamily protein
MQGPNRNRSKSPSGEEAIAQIHKDLSKQLQKEFALTTNLDFTNIDLSAVLKKDARSLLCDEGEGVDVQVTLKDVEDFFRFLNPMSQKIQKEHVKDLVRKINGCSEREAEKKANLLLGGKESIDYKTLYAMIQETKFVNFDPLEQAFQELGPDEQGNLDPEHIKRLIEALGLGSIDKKDLHLLQEVADIDKNGKITLEDFKALATDMANFKEEEKKQEPE